MPFIVYPIAAATYAGIGFAVRAKFYPREKPVMALAWPAVIVIMRGGK